MSQTEIKSKIKVNEKITEPPMYKVIYINDNQTPVEFVIESLIDHFDYNTDTAQEITLNIHQTGSAVVAVLPYEVAEQKGVEVTVEARSQGYPLQIKLEPQS